MAKEGLILLTDLYPRVEQSLAKKENTDLIKKTIEGYLDRNMDRLTTAGPVHRILFTDIDSAPIFTAINVEPTVIQKMLKESSIIIGKHVPIMSNPFNSACVMAIRYYMLKNNEDVVRMLLTYLTLSMYPSLHKKYFRKAEPNENIMNYTINNLSNKFKIKQLGTIYHALVDTTMVCYKTNQNKLKRCSDKDILDFVQDVKTRLNSLLRKISIEFYKNHKNGNYLNLEVDNYDDDNYREADSNTFVVERLTNTVVLKLTVEGPKTNLVTIAAKFCQVSVNELRNYVETKIVGENREDIRKLVESILFLFIFDAHNHVNEVSSNKFFAYCLEMYRKSNTTDENIIKIKKILDSWLEDLGAYKKTQRLATINDFRRALFVFMVLSIQTSSH